MADEPRPDQLARTDVVTCSLTDRIGGVAQQMAESPYGFALVSVQLLPSEKLELESRGLAESGAHSGALRTPPPPTATSLTSQARAAWDASRQRSSRRMTTGYDLAAGNRLAACA